MTPPPRVGRAYLALFAALYARIIQHAVRHVAVMMLAFVALVALSGWWFMRLPTGFLPTEDQGFAILGVQLPDAASQTRTRAVVDKVSAILKRTPGVQSWFLIGGQSIMDQAVASNASAMEIANGPATSPPLPTVRLTTRSLIMLAPVSAQAPGNWPGYLGLS